MNMVSEDVGRNDHPDTGGRDVYVTGNISSVGSHDSNIDVDCDVYSVDCAVHDNLSVSGAAVDTRGASDVLDFDLIKYMCENDKQPGGDQFHPRVFASHRRQNWPNINRSDMHPHLVCIYDSVRATGVPNTMGARTPLPTKLNLENWEKYLSDSHDHKELLDCIKF